MKTFYRCLVAAVGAAVCFSCTENGGMIYTSIQKATKTSTSSTIPTDITVSDIATEGTDNPLYPYYVAAGKVYNGSKPSSGSTTWSAIGVPKTSGSDMLCNTLAYDSVNKKLWGGFYSSDGSTFGLYPAAAGSDFSSSSAVTDSLIAGKQITHLAAINGDLFAVTATLSGGSYMYALDVLPSGSSSWHTLISSLSKSITGVGFLGSTYFITSGPNLYAASGSSPIGSSPSAWTLNGGAISASDGQSSSNDVLQGVFIDNSYTSGTIIVVPASNTGVSPQTGNLYFSTNGGSSWTHLSKQANGYNVGFLCVAGPVDSGHTTYLLGADSGAGGAFGFYSLVPSSSSLSRFDGTSYSLYYSAVRRILVDFTNSLVAIGTTDNGLWVTTSMDSSGSFSSNSWSQE